MEDEDSLETSLEHLDELDNLEQLLVLNQEIELIFYHNYDPPDDWYQHRIQKIQAYFDLDWNGMAERFQNKNPMIVEASTHIRHMLYELLEEWSTSPSFNLTVYHRVIKLILELWQFYQTNYIGGEKDEDVIDLIEQMTHMSS